MTLTKIVQLERHETVDTSSEHYNDKVAGSIPIRGNIFDEFIFLQYDSGRTARMIYFRENSNDQRTSLNSSRLGTVRVAMVTL